MPDSTSENFPQAGKFIFSKTEIFSEDQKNFPVAGNTSGNFIGW